MPQKPLPRLQTANSSNCDLQSPDEVPVISSSAVLAAPNVTNVLLSEVTALLVTTSIEERTLAPAAPLLRVPYLKRLLEAVRNGIPLDRLPDALRSAVIQTHDDLATYITEIVLAMFDGPTTWSASFRSLTNPLTVSRAVLSQMRYVADVAFSLPSKAYFTSGGLFWLVWRQCRGRALTLRITVFLFVPQPVAALKSRWRGAAAPVSSCQSNCPVRVVTLQPNGSETFARWT